MSTVSTSPVRLRKPDRLGRTQSQIWAGQRLHPDAPIANMALRVRFDFAVDPARFDRAFSEVVRASDSLRSTFSDEDGHPVVRVADKPPRPVEVIDLPGELLDDWCAARIATPIDISQCVYDSVLLHHDEHDWTWWLDIHHIATDAVSHTLVVDATGAAYVGDSVDLSSYADHLDRVRAEAATEQWRAAKIEWSDRVAPAPLALYGPAGPATTSGRRQTVVLDDDGGPPNAEGGLESALRDTYRSISPELGLLGLLATATAALMHRLDGRSEVTIGVPIHHRSGADVARTIGPLLELYPLDLHVEHHDTFRTLHRRAQRAVLTLLRNALPGASPPQDYAVVLNVIGATVTSFGGEPIRCEWVPSGHADPSHLLRVQAHRFDGGTTALEIDVNDAVGHPLHRLRVSQHFGRLLAAAIADPDAEIAEVTLVDKDERLALDLVNPVDLSPGPATAIHDRIRETLRADPGRVVLEQGERNWCAGEVDQIADGLAHWLISQGVSPGDRIGVRMERSAEVVFALQGILRSGAAFVPMDPGDPGPRHEAIIADAALSLVLDALPAADAPPSGFESSLPIIDPGAEAYVLYTSGSTGAPKGVPISHAGLASYLEFAEATYVDRDRPPTMALHSSLVFDLTITSLFLPLVCGGRTIVVPGGSVEALAAVATDERIDLLKATPSQLEVLIQLGGPTRSLRTLVVGGEAFRRPLALELEERVGRHLAIFNEYGPTEAVVGCMLHRFDRDTDLDPDVPIGRAARDAEIFVLDDRGHRCVEGAWGELWVRRPGMAARYLNLPELSAERFRALPDVGGPALYRTGDRARVLRPGVLVYGGRRDDQLKVNGVRLEPGEVEAALVSHPLVHDAVVRLWSPGRTTAPQRCQRCGLGSDVPGIRFDAHGVCSTCLDYDEVRVQAAKWFRTPEDLALELELARADAVGEWDCLLLLSGGKDSTYALYQAVEAGWRVRALTLDNGYIAEGAKENIRRSVADLGIEHEFVETDHMAAIFRDSLERFSNVCNGCYKTIYTLAVNRAVELGIPVIMTGLSRGQFFETRLVPHQFASGHFDPAAIDRAVLEARKVYHRTADAVSDHLDTSLFATDDVFDQVRFVDFYRYVDVDLDELYSYLERRAPWVRPADTGRSTNCLINVAGIHVHQLEQGFHNYALPYSWDVKMGHKSRDQALDELDDQYDLAEVERILAEISYTPRKREILTAWYRSDSPVPPEELRAHLRSRLADHAIPSAFVRMEEIPLARSAKVDLDALPAPTRIHRAELGWVAPTTPTEEILCDIWGEVLGLEQVGVEHDFFDLGGDSLAALEMITRVVRALDVDLPDTVAFQHRTVAELARLVARTTHNADRVGSMVGTDVSNRGSESSSSLSPAQQALQFEVRSDPGSPRYGVTRHYRISGSVDARRLQNAFGTVVGRHRTLRESFSDPRRVLSVDDALSFSTIEQGADFDITESADQLASRPFNIDEGPLVRVLLRPGTTTELVVSLHHLWCDATSFDILWQEVSDAYVGLDRESPEPDYAAHAVRMRAGLSDDRLIEALARIPDEAASPDLGFRRPSLASADGYLTRVVRTVGTDRAPFAAFVAAVDVLVRRHTDGPLVVGVPMSTRGSDDSGVIGLFLNTVPLVLPPIEGRSFGSVLGAVEEELVVGLSFRSVPYAEIVARRRADLRPSHLADVMVVHDLVPSEHLGDLEIDGRTVFNGAAVAPLSFFIRDGQGEVVIGAEYSGAVFEAADVECLLADLAAIYRAGLAEPDVLAVDLAADRLPSDLLGPELLDAVRPVVSSIWEHDRDDHVAVRQGSHTRSYSTLIEQAETMAQALLRAGVGPGDRVALVLRRSIDQVIAILGVLRIGAAYVPVDPHYPDARIDVLIANTTPVLVVVDNDRARDIAGQNVAGKNGPPMRALDSLLEEVAHEDLGPLPTLHDPAYVIHTSGSTGGPKPVLVRHGSLAASNHARIEHYSRPPERFLWTSGFSFDSSVAGLFWTLACGGELVLPDDQTTLDVDHLVELVAKANITHLLTVPSVWAAMLDRDPVGERMGGLYAVIVAGEACGADVAAAHHRTLPEVELWNEYGPSEATVWSTVHRVEVGDDPVPIGLPVAGTRLRVAGPDLRPRPAGVSGELLIAGSGLADGYLDRPSDTKRAFVVDADGKRWYRTGDLVRRRPTGQLDFLGRIDDQLSVGGLRVEPGEIEEVLVSWPGVRAAVVRSEATSPPDPVAALRALGDVEARRVLSQAADDVHPVDRLVEEVAQRSGGPPRLVAHVESDSVAEGVLIGHLRSRLPRHLVPSRVVVHGRLPRSPNGKIDRRAIPLAPSRSAGVRLSVEEDGGGVTAVIACWRRVLGDIAVDADTDLFDTGADSLSAVEVVQAMSDEFGVDLPVSALLAAPTPRAMSALLGPNMVSEGWSLSVPLQIGAVGRPGLVVIAPGGSQLIAYLPLVAALPATVPVVGVQTPAVADDPIDTVEGFADRFLPEILAAQPTGPIQLFGASTSGLMAYELAARLEATGREVALVGLADTYFPGVNATRTAAIERWIERRRKRYGPLIDEYGWRGMAREFSRSVQSRFGQDASPSPSAATDDGRMRQILALGELVRRAEARYVVRPIRSSVVFYAAEGTNPAHTVQRWRSIIPDLEVVVVPGNHTAPDGFLSEANVGRLAADLSVRLR